MYAPKIEALLALTDKPYSEYNAVLPLIKSNIVRWDNFGPVRLDTFIEVLAEELPDNTARRAYRIAILVALGVEIHRETKRKHEHN
jgi:hypothetical protein